LLLLERRLLRLERRRELGARRRPRDDRLWLPAPRRRRCDPLLRPRLGTLPPARRASDRPIAIACLRLLTFRPERPDRSRPRFISCIDFSTFFEALRPYFRGMDWTSCYTAFVQSGPVPAGSPISSPWGSRAVQRLRARSVPSRP